MASRMTYDSPPGRIGRAKAAILRYSMPVQVLAVSGVSRTMTKHNSNTMIFRRWLPPGGSLEGTGRTRASNMNQWRVNPTDYRLVEGQTPEPRTLAPQDIPVTMRQYGILYSYSDQAEDMYEDNFREPMRKQAGLAAGLIREKIRWSKLRGGINRYYPRAVAGRNLVKAALSQADLRAIGEILKSNRADFLKSAIRNPKAGNDLAQIEQGFCLFAHTNMETTFREMDDFVPRVKYGNDGMIPMSGREIGAVENFRIILSPELDPLLGAGADADAAADKVRVTGGKADIYPVLAIAKDAWADLTLANSRSIKSVNEIRAGTPSKYDPLGQVGFIGVKFYATSFIQNDGWMVVAESASTDPAQVS